MKKLLLLACMMVSALANAQFIPGQVLTAAQLNSVFATKAPIPTGTCLGSGFALNYNLVSNTFSCNGTIGAVTLNGNTFQSPGPIGSVSPSTGSFTNLTANGTLTFANGSITLPYLATQSANTVVANTTAGSASPTAVSVPSCSTSASAINYTSGTGFGCNSAINAAQLGGATFAAPGAIGSTTPSTGKFTTLSTTAQSKVIATTTNAQSIPNNAFTTVTTWTASVNQGSNFTASTGVYTVPAAGLYDIRFNFRLSAAALTAANGIIASIFDNGVEIFQAVVPVQATGTISLGASISALVNCGTGDAITVRVFQNSGAAITLDGNALDNWLMISQVP